MGSARTLLGPKYTYFWNSLIQTRNPFQSVEQRKVHYYLLRCIRAAHTMYNNISPFSLIISHFSQRVFPEALVFVCGLSNQKFRKDTLLEIPNMEFCVSVPQYPVEDMSQIVDGYVEFIQIKVLKLISWRVITKNQHAWHSPKKILGWTFNNEFELKYRFCETFCFQCYSLYCNWVRISIRNLWG